MLKIILIDKSELDSLFCATSRHETCLFVGYDLDLRLQSVQDDPQRELARIADGADCSISQLFLIKIITGFKMENSLFLEK